MKLKKLVILAVCVALAIGIVGCGKSNLSDDESVKITKVEYKVPEGFAVSPESNDVVVTKDYPVDESKLTVTTSEKSKEFCQLSKEAYEETFRGALKIGDTEAKTKLLEFEHGEIDGFRSIKGKVEFSFGEKKIILSQLLIDGDKTHLLSFMNAGDTDWIPQIDKMYKNIKIKYEKK